jgi:4-methylaminobutanoate oxidase (formaldehyde-forming)
MHNQIPDRTRVAIIGGGVIGCSLAYHLTKLGWRDVTVLERKQLTAGTTWHAAGLIVSGGFSSETTIGMAKYSRELYARLEEETELSTGFKPVGYIQLATTRPRLEELRRIAGFVRGCGVNVEEISQGQVREMWPLARTDDVLAGFYIAEDGRANPVDVTMSLAKGARMGGVRIFENTKVIGITQKNGRVTGVTTTQGHIEAEFVVNCGGMWGREVGRMAGVKVPLQAAEHYYLCTEPMDGVHGDLPVLEDLENFAYFREEGGGIMLGLFEPAAAPWGMKGIPDDFCFGDLPPDWDRMIPYIQNAMERIPTLKEAGIRLLFCGPESFTPDMGPLIGEAPELKNFFVAAGLNSLGILLGGGVGRVLAHWIVEGLPPVDVCEINIDRMLPFQNNPKYLEDRTREILGMMYVDHWPNRRFETARNVRKSILHDRLAAAGASFAESKGWEFPDWFAPQGVEPKVEYSWGRQNWFPYAAAEHRACREGVVLIDLTLMSKFLVQGRDAEKVLNFISANDVAMAVGSCVYTQWLNQRGGIEADVTVSRLAEDRFFVVSSDIIHTRVETWLKKHTPPEAHCFTTDVTSGYTLIQIQGPDSRELLSRVTSADLSNQAFPYRTIREIDLGYALVWALRLSYLGELGWELYVPTEFALSVYDTLVEAGRDLDLRHAGLQTLNSLRLEKGYRDYGHDLDNMDTPLEAGLGFAVAFDKPGGFIGREALLEQKAAGELKRRLVQFLVIDPEPLLYHGEPIFRDGVRVGYIRSGAYGHTLGGAVGLGYVENDAGVSGDYITTGRFEIEVAGVRYGVRASLKPMYDGENVRLRM